jgi:hypothetical protein
VSGGEREREREREQEAEWAEFRPCEPQCRLCLYPWSEGNTEGLELME